MVCHRQDGAANGADPVKEVIRLETKKTEISTSSTCVLMPGPAAILVEQDNALVGEDQGAAVELFKPSLLTSSPR